MDQFEGNAEYNKKELFDKKGRKFLKSIKQTNDKKPQLGFDRHNIQDEINRGFELFKTLNSNIHNSHPIEPIKPNCSST